jgi:hypothetical protein
VDTPLLPPKDSSPLIIDRESKRQLPSLSPDILVSFSNDPLRPYFGDFVASSPSTRVGTVHGRASQIASLIKIQHYSKHHTHPDTQFYPLAFERSGYLHPTFHDFIDLYCMLGLPAPDPKAKLQMTFAVAYAITFTTAAFLKSASALLYPDHIRTFLPPRPTPTPQRWAPDLFHLRTNSRRLFSASSHIAPSSPLPLTTSSVASNADCVLNHEYVHTTRFSDLLEVVEALPHGSSLMSHSYRYLDSGHT